MSETWKLVRHDKVLRYDEDLGWMTVLTMMSEKSCYNALRFDGCMVLRYCGGFVGHFLFVEAGSLFFERAPWPIAVHRSFTSILFDPLGRSEAVISLFHKCMCLILKQSSMKPICFRDPLPTLLTVLHGQ